MDFELEKRECKPAKIRVVSSNMDIQLELKGSNDFEILDLIVKRLKTKYDDQWISFKDWIKELVDIEPEYKFLLEGSQTGEIDDMHEYYISGLTPQEAITEEYRQNG